MKVIELVFDSQFVGRISTIVEVPDDADIKSLFKSKLGIPFNKDCWYREIKE